MAKFKSSFFGKVVSTVVIFTFLTLDITRAGSFSIPRTETLATENAFQASAKDFNNSFLSQAPVLNSILSIGNYLLNETKTLSTDERLEGLASVIGKRSSHPELDVQSKIKFPYVKFHPDNENIVIIPYEVKEGKTVYVQVAFAENISPDDLKGFTWTVTDKSKYAVTILPKDYDPSQPQPTVPIKKPKIKTPVISEKTIAEIEIEEPTTTSEPNKSLRIKKVIIKAITLSSLILLVIPFFIWSCAAKTICVISTPPTTFENRPAPKTDKKYGIANTEKTTTKQIPKKLDTEGLTSVKDLGIEWVFGYLEMLKLPQNLESWNLLDEGIENLYGKLVYPKVYRIYIGSNANCVGCLYIANLPIFGLSGYPRSYMNDEGIEMWPSFLDIGEVSMAENLKSLEKRYGELLKDFTPNEENGHITATIKSPFGKNFSIISPEKEAKVLFGHDKYHSAETGMIQAVNSFMVRAATGGKLKIHKDVGFFKLGESLTINSEFTVMEDFNTGLKSIKYWGEAGEKWYIIRARKDSENGKIILESGSQAKLIYDEFQLTASDILVNTGKNDIDIEFIGGWGYRIGGSLEPNKAGIIFGGELCVFENTILNKFFYNAISQNNTQKISEMADLLILSSLDKYKVSKTFDKMLPGYGVLSSRPTYFEVGATFAQISNDADAVRLLSSKQAFQEERDLTKLETALVYVSYVKLFNGIADNLTDKRTSSEMLSLLNTLTRVSHKDIFSKIRSIVSDSGFGGLHGVAKVKNLVNNAKTQSKHETLEKMCREIASVENKNEILTFVKKVNKAFGINFDRLEILARIIEYDFPSMLDLEGWGPVFFNPDATFNRNSLLNDRNLKLLFKNFASDKITLDGREPGSIHSTVSDAVNRSQKPTNKTYALFESVTRDPNNTRTVLVNAGNDIAEFLAENGSREMPQIDENNSAAEISEKLKKTLAALDASNIPLPEKIRESKNKIEANMNFFVTAMVSSIELLAREAKNDNKNLVIGIDPNSNWIPGYESGKFQHNAMNPLINELSSIPAILEKRGLKNVSVFIKEKEEKESLGAWAEKMQNALDSPGDFSNLIVIGDNTTTSYFENNFLQNISNDNRAVLAEINPKNLHAFYSKHGEDPAWQLDINLARFISITVDIALDNRTPTLDDLKIDFDPNLKKIIYFPDAIKVDYQKNVTQNKLNKTTLRSL